MLTYHHKSPPSLSRMGKRKQVGGGANIPCEWKLTLNDHSTIEETVALIQGALVIGKGARQALIGSIAVVYDLPKRTQEMLFADWAQ